MVRLGLLREHDVVDLALRLCRIQLFDQFGITATRPGPAADLTQRLLVDTHQHDLAAGRMLVDVVTDDAQAIFGIFAGTDQAENQAKEDCPSKQPGRVLFPLFPFFSAASNAFIVGP